MYLSFEYSRVISKCFTRICQAFLWINSHIKPNSLPPKNLIHGPKITHNFAHEKSLINLVLITTLIGNENHFLLTISVIKILSTTLIYYPYPKENNLQGLPTISQFQTLINHTIPRLIKTSVYLKFHWLKTYRKIAE